MKKTIISIVLLLNMLAFVGCNKYFTISFDTQGGNEMDAVIMGGDDKVIPSNPYREGYHFDGWYFDKECTNYFAEWFSYGEDITIYAKWRSVQLTVKFFDNEKALIGDVYYVNYGEKFTEVPNAPTVSGKTFVGWYCDSDFTGEFDADSLIYDNYALYAKYE